MRSSTWWAGLVIQTFLIVFNKIYYYLTQSPEVLLNKEMFTRIFFSQGFRERLALVVVDEAHIVYVWGLVASGQAKTLSSHGRHMDWGTFWPSYGDLGTRLLATNGVPFL